ncbi:hypothetical protein AVEN_73937-1, partial [Araneus ventricosus]
KGNTLEYTRKLRVRHGLSERVYKDGAWIRGSSDDPLGTALEFRPQCELGS